MFNMFKIEDEEIECPYCDELLEWSSQYECWVCHSCEVRI